MTQSEDTAPRRRSQVSKRLRFEILRRDEHTCRYCGAKAPEVKLVVDHVVPDTLGGTNDASNLVACCEDCNKGKSSVPADAPTVAAVAEDAIRWQRAIQHAADLLESEREDLQERIDYADDLWSSWYTGPDKRQIWRPDDWNITVGRWLALGLSLDNFEEAVTIAMGNRRVNPDNTWRYLCGIMWAKATELQKMAKQLIDAGVV